MGTVTVITGAASGMGLACAERLAGTSEVLVLADLAPVDPAALEQDCTVVTVRADVSDRGDVEALARTAASHGEVRHLVHAAGVSPTMGDARRMFDVDLVGSVLMADAFRPVMASGGSAVFFASVAAHLVMLMADGSLDDLLADPLAEGAADRFVEAVGNDSGLGYGWAKQGVIRLARRSAATWGERGARINTVSPGTIDTPMGVAELAGQPVMHTMLEMTPAGRVGRADELADAVAFLLSDRAAYITGTDLLVDGGVVATMLSS